ncbi:MAG: prepilin peptidase [Verrucomicrobiota bacterium]|nr:prepilin peptidase [Verrucomicrobiota bacterium]
MESAMPTMLDDIPPVLFQILVFVYGACIGSFLNVCIYRIPVNRSVVTPGSHCACGKPIVWYDNIPILSWLILRGHARCCGRYFSIRYPLVELLTGGLFLLSWMTNPPLAAIAGMVFISLMVGASFIDYDTKTIPDLFAVGGLFAGVILAVFIPSMHGFADGMYVVDAFRSFVYAVEGALIGSALILWIRVFGEIIMRREAMGFGDITLMGAIGAFCGWKGAVFAVFGGAVLGTLAYLLGMVLSKIFPAKADDTLTSPTSVAFAELQHSAGGEEPSEPEDLPPVQWEGDPMQIPFGPSLAAAGVLYFTVMRGPVDAYFAAITDTFASFQ